MNKKICKKCQFGFLGRGIFCIHCRNDHIELYLHARPKNLAREKGKCRLCEADSLKRVYCKLCEWMLKEVRKKSQPSPKLKIGICVDCKSAPKERGSYCKPCMDERRKLYKKTDGHRKTLCRTDFSRRRVEIKTLLKEKK